MTSTTNDAGLTFRELREDYAIQYTERYRLERENADLKAQLDTMRARDLRNLDELTDAYTSQSIQLADALASLDFWQTSSSDWQLIASSAERSRELRDIWLTARNREIKDLRETIAGLLTHDAVGEDCETCEGTGKVGGEHSVHEDYAGHVPAETVCPEDGCYSGRCER